MQLEKAPETRRFRTLIWPIYTPNNGHFTPTLLITPDPAPSQVISPTGKILGDYLALLFAQSGWREHGEPPEPHTWALTANGPCLAVTNGRDRLITADIAPGAWLCHVIANGGADVIYNPSATPETDPRLIVHGPHALTAHLPLRIGHTIG